MADMRAFGARNAHTALIRGKARLALWGLAAITAAALTVTVFRYLEPRSWWAQSGLPSDPGNFVAMRKVDYPVCAPWRGAMAGALRSAAHVETATARAVDPKGAGVNLGFLLPKTARIAAVYCATVGNAGKAAECSTEGCDPPVRALVMDSLYTRGRALVVTLIGRGARPADVRLWVIWAD